ncbi:ATP-binding protein [Bdellovibrio sp. HCB274]|uniref:ATP-binding protein n=1 Tax=Bdellovibrio sp. HCB274 TaxID=3394361 RepID=UPI0039B46FED
MGNKAETVQPAPAATITSLRAVGYKIDTAIADIIDNSISAGAHNIWIRIVWNDGAPWVSILDDGIGMSKDELIQAMRPGSKDPEDERSASDLGRFGLGLKTASFSQAKLLNVYSKKSRNADNSRCWDLEYVRSVGQWTLLKDIAGPSPELMECFNSLSSGTLVIWQNLDKFTLGMENENLKGEKHFFEAVAMVRDSLSLIFHRFISGRNKEKRMVSIFVNGEKEEFRIKAWDPFLPHIASQMMPRDTVVTSTGTIVLGGIVLPHRDKVDSDSEYRQLAGPFEMSQHQGFYVYRNDRLLTFGDWLDLSEGGKKWRREEPYKLARIFVDISNTEDKSWMIDIKKAMAVPPAEIRDRLKSYSKVVREKAKQVYWYRARIGSSPTHTTAEPEVPVWINFSKGNRKKYEINRSHPLIESLSRKLGMYENRFQNILSLVERAVPVEKIYVDASDSESVMAPRYDEKMDEELIDFLNLLFLDCVDKLNRTSNDKENIVEIALKEIGKIEPFNRYSNLSAYLRKNN